MKYFFITLAFFLSGCNLTDEYLQQILNNIEESNNPPCEGYEEILEPAFVGFYTTLDAVPTMGYYFFYDDQIIDLYSFLSQYGTTTLYFNGVHIAGFVDGTNDLGALMGDLEIFAHNESGPINLVFGSQRIYPRGAVTFGQFLEELMARPSVRHLHFSGTSFTCAEYNQLIDFILEDCKAGRDKIDMRVIPDGCISQEKIDELELRGWELVL